MASGLPRKPPLAASLALCCLLGPQSCTLTQPAAVPPAPACPHVPPPPTSKPSPPPVAAFPQMLQPGHWEWNDGSYIWTAPAWRARSATPAPRWRDGYWEANGGACVWHNGHFVPVTARPVSGTAR